MSILDDVLVAEAARLDALPADLRVVELVKLSASLPVLASISNRLEKGEDVAQDEIDALAKGRGGKAISDFVAYVGQAGRRAASSIKSHPNPGPKTATTAGTIAAAAASVKAGRDGRAGRDGDGDGKTGEGRGGDTAKPSRSEDPLGALRAEGFKVTNTMRRTVDISADAIARDEVDLGNGDVGAEHPDRHKTPLTPRQAALNAAFNRENAANQAARAKRGLSPTPISEIAARGRDGLNAPYHAKRGDVDPVTGKPHEKDYGSDRSSVMRVFDKYLASSGDVSGAKKGIDKHIADLRRSKNPAILAQADRVQGELSESLSRHHNRSLTARMAAQAAGAKDLGVAADPGRRQKLGMVTQRKRDFSNGSTLWKPK